MKISFFINIFVFLLISTSSFAQLERANKCYEAKEYAKAIKLYENILKKNENAEALEKTANSYRLLKNYRQAEVFYERLMKQKNVAPINHLNYGMVLKKNSKIDAAEAEFKQYSSSVPGDNIGKMLIKSCNDVKELEKNEKQFDVNLLPNINTLQSEFSPVLFKNQLVFISDRNKNLFNEIQDFFHVYSVEIKNDPAGTTKFSKIAKSFPYPINTNYHDGPVCFNTEQNLMYITHVDLLNKKDKKFINRSKLYSSALKGKKWSKVKPFQYNSDEYSVAHACVSADGKTMFFASDMPGGQGGMDIWMCEKEGENWGSLKNLGNKVNTVGDDVFPYIRKDGVLYFSSDGHSGFGGLDLFSATKINEKYGNVKNMEALLNSAADDFGIIFSDDNKTGYFSSNRVSGIGFDDIYSFTSLNKLITISGKIVLSQNINNPLKNSEISILNENGKTLNTTATDNSGFFSFGNLDPGKKYMIKLDETEPGFITKIKYYLADDRDALIRETGIDGKGGKFVFRNLPANPNALPEVSIDGITFAGNLLFGKNSTKPLGNTKVNLLNDKGDVVQSVITNVFGAFVFTTLPSDQNFLVKVDENDTDLPADTKIILTNKSGKEMQSTAAAGNGGFKFSFLASDKATLAQMTVENTDLRRDFKGKFVSDNKMPLANSKVNLVNEKGEILQTTQTEADGTFHFSNLAADQVVLFALDENDTQLKKLKKIFLTDNKDAVVKEVYRENNSFKFTILPMEKEKLSVVYIDDPWLKVLALKSSVRKENLTIIEKVYYDFGKYSILPEASKILDKVINIMEKDPLLVIEISSHTDARSSNVYNLQLSEKRANAAVEYIIKGGIAKGRLSGKGYGESQLINKCVDGVECTEEEHAKNRRTEFKISRKEK